MQSLNYSPKVGNVRAGERVGTDTFLFVLCQNEDLIAALRGISLDSFVIDEKFINEYCINILGKKPRVIEPFAFVSENATGSAIDYNLLNGKNLYFGDVNVLVELGSAAYSYAHLYLFNSGSDETQITIHGQTSSGYLGVKSNTQFVPSVIFSSWTLGGATALPCRLNFKGYRVSF